MTADKSTANFSFFYFFSELVKLAFAARSEQLFTLSSGCRNKLGSLGHRLRKRTIVQNAPRQQGRTWLELVISCVNEQLFVIPNSSRPDTADAAGMTRAQGEQLFRTRQAA
jgi:hypothetical protein